MAFTASNTIYIAFGLLIVKAMALLDCYDGVQKGDYLKQALISEVQDETGRLRGCNRCAVRRIFVHDGENHHYEAVCLLETERFGCDFGDVLENNEIRKFEYVQCCTTWGCNKLPRRINAEAPSLQAVIHGFAKNTSQTSNQPLPDQYNNATYRQSTESRVPAINNSTPSPQKSIDTVFTNTPQSVDNAGSSTNASVIPSTQGPTYSTDQNAAKRVNNITSQNNSNEVSASFGGEGIESKTTHVLECFKGERRDRKVEQHNVQHAITETRKPVPCVACVIRKQRLNYAAFCKGKKGVNCKDIKDNDSTIVKCCVKNRCNDLRSYKGIETA